MNKAGSASKVKLSSFDDLFGSTEKQPGAEPVQEIPLSELHDFQGHPFRVADDEKMEETVESVRQYGVLVPGIARRRDGGGYEIIAGHRRKRACELSGLKTMPVFVRDYDDDEATVIMVDTNIQRENILPSEKAKAYAMKYEAMKHQGSKAGGRTIEEMGESSGESAKTVQRYIWLSRLLDGLLAMVDEKKLGFVQGIDISFLTDEMQETVFQLAVSSGISISTAQSAKLKEYGKSGELTPAMARLILTEEKPKTGRFVLRQDKIEQYFPDRYSNEDIEKTILILLENWKAEGARRLWDT